MFLALEALQYLLAIGSADITDLILNTLGTALGVGLYYLLRLVFRQKTDKVLSVCALIGAVLAVLFVVFLFIVSY